MVLTPRTLHDRKSAVEKHPPTEPLLWKAARSGLTRRVAIVTDKPTRGRPLSSRTLRDMALDDFADGADELAAAKTALAHVARRVLAADTHMVRGYHRFVGAQEHEDRLSAPWDGTLRRSTDQNQNEMVA